MSLTSLTESHVRSQQSHGLTTLRSETTETETEKWGLKHRPQCTDQPRASPPRRVSERHASQPAAGISRGIGFFPAPGRSTADLRRRSDVEQDEMSPLASPPAVTDRTSPRRTAPRAS